jgi:Lipid A core - O-antigen ligase and related enzymes
MTAGKPARRTPLKRFFLWRRAIDPILLTLATATFMLPGDIAVWLFAIFGAIGLYLIAIRHRSIRRMDRRYAAATAILALSALSIGFANGSLPEDFRWASYPAYYLAVVPLSVGVVLVRDPMRQLVIGARIGIVIVTVWSLAALASGAYRYGFGSNSANAAFAVTFLAILSRLKVSAPPRLLASGRAYFYLGLIPVLVTGTRATVTIFVAGLFIDLIGLLRGQHQLSPGGSRMALGGSLVAAAMLAGAGWLLAPTIEARVSDTVREITNLSDDPAGVRGGLSVRLVLWNCALEVIEDHPLTGVGGLATKPALLAKIPEEHRKRFAELSFSHNFLLDEGMQRGFLGIIVLVGFYAFTVHRIARYGTPDIRENLALAMLLILTFGMLHYLLLVDRHVALIAIYFIVLITDNQRRRLRARWQLPAREPGPALEPVANPEPAFR